MRQIIIPGYSIVELDDNGKDYIVPSYAYVNEEFSAPPSTSIKDPIGPGIVAFSR